MKPHLARALPLAGLLAIGLAVPAAAAVVNGTNGPDVLVGTDHADTMHGFRGADRIYGKAGADRIFGGRDSKRDLLYGGPGNDQIWARLGDNVYAGTGNDVIRIGTAAWHMTHIWCGPGIDHVYGYNPWLVTVRGCEKLN